MKLENSQKLNELKVWLGNGSINIFGYPFAGKDTLAHNLSKLLQAPVISGGDILRSHSDQDTIKKLMLTGELFPTDYYLGIILPYISQNKFANNPLILSSVGRWSGEESTIIKACDDSGHPMKAVLHLNVPVEVIWDRFKMSQEQQDRAHRHDDASHILEVRLAEYQAKTLPVIDFYRQRGLLVEIDGHKAIEDTTQEAINKLKSFIESNNETST